MSFRSPACLRSIVARRLGLGTGNSSFATSTAPKLKAYSPPISFGRAPETNSNKSTKGDFVPVYVAVGMIILSASLGIHTAMHQLKRNPSISVKKSRRETIPELVEPEKVVDEADRFVKESFFRKVAHVQEPTEVVGDPIRGSPLARKAKAETLKSVGVDPAVQ